MTDLLNMTAGAQRMAQTDPHGWTLALIAVTTVFTALLILYFIYNMIGKAAQKSLSGTPRGRKAKKAKAGTAPDADTAAAIAMALESELGGEVNAAIAMALHLYLNDTVHDIEPDIITIMPRQSSWNDKTLTFRKTPRK